MFAVITCTYKELFVVGIFETGRYAYLLELFRKAAGSVAKRSKYTFYYGYFAILFVAHSPRCRVGLVETGSILRPARRNHQFVEVYVESYPVIRIEGEKVRSSYTEIRRHKVARNTFVVRYFATDIRYIETESESGRTAWHLYRSRVITIDISRKTYTRIVTLCFCIQFGGYKTKSHTHREIFGKTSGVTQVERHFVRFGITQLGPVIVT